MKFNKASFLQPKSMVKKASSNPYDIAEDVSIQLSRAQRERLTQEKKNNGK